MTATSATTAETWQRKVAVKQNSCLKKIPNEWLLPSSVAALLQTPLSEYPNALIQMDIPKKSGILTQRELEITEDFTVVELLNKLKVGEVTALEVTIAFSKRAAIAQQLLSCLTETYFQEAQERAKFLDKSLSQGKVIGPLHGLPVSLKDSFQILGSQATLGFVSYLDHVSTKNSPLVEILEGLGAVIYVKTNIPQTLMTADSHNNVFGRTLNPHKTTLGAGGSSGGEGALVAFRGSPLGIGTDIAGSIRIPSLCCGTYGFKPTASRIPYGGQSSSSRPGMSFFLPSAGPLANDMEALSTLTRSVLNARPALFDCTALDIPWRDIPKNTSLKLRLGLLAEDSVFPLHPPVKRALANVVELLKMQGHEIVQISAAEAQVANSTVLAWEYFGLDTTALSHIKAGGEPIIPSIIHIEKSFAKIESTFCKDVAGLEGVPRLAALNVKRMGIAESWRRLWASGLDAVISPAAQHTAVPHDMYGLPPYTLFLNLLDYPACVIPYGTASSDLDAEHFAVGPGQVGPDYDPKTMENAPTSIQVFTNKMRDEECLRIGEIIDACLRPAT